MARQEIDISAESADTAPEGAAKLNAMTLEIYAALAALAPGRILAYHKLTGVGTWSPGADTRVIEGLAVGSGGGGGPADTGKINLSGGGGGHVRFRLLYPFAASYAYSVGTGGAPGATGGNTTFGSPVLAFAGGGFSRVLSGAVDYVSAGLRFRAGLSPGDSYVNSPAELIYCGNAGPSGVLIAGDGTSVASSPGRSILTGPTSVAGREVFGVGGLGGKDTTAANPGEPGVILLWERS